jgi:hypothetical protein
MIEHTTFLLFSQLSEFVRCSKNEASGPKMEADGVLKVIRGASRRSY